IVGYAYCVRVGVASTPFCFNESRVRFTSSISLYGPRRTRYHTPLSGMVAVWMLDSSPSKASLALSFSASSALEKEHACKKGGSPAARGLLSALFAANGLLSTKGW